MNRADGEAAAAFYAKSAVMEERDLTPASVSRGREEIAARLERLVGPGAGLRLALLGTPIQSGRFVGEAVRFLQSGGTGAGEGILVFELDDAGKIEHQWVMGETRP